MIADRLERLLDSAVERFERHFEEVLARSTRRVTVRFFCTTLRIVAGMHSILFALLWITR